MRDQVDFRKARHRHAPALGLQRDVMFEQAARLRPPIDPRAHLALGALQPPIHLAGTHPPHQGLRRRRQAQPAARPRQPRREQRFQAHRPRVARGRPDGPQRRDHVRPIAHRPAAAPATLPGFGPPQPADHRFPVIPRHLTDLIEQPPFLLTARSLISLLHPRQILSPRLWSHSGASHPNPPVMGNPISGATNPRSVTFSMARYALLTYSPGPSKLQNRQKP